MTEQISTTLVKDSLSNSTIAAQAFVISLQELDNPELKPLVELVLSYQRKVFTQLPQQSQQFLMALLAKPKIQSLPFIYKELCKVERGTPELIFTQLHTMVEKLIAYKARGKKLDENKYKLLLEYIEAEIDADLTGGVSAVSCDGTTIAFKLVLPEPKIRTHE